MDKQSDTPKKGKFFDETELTVCKPDGSVLFVAIFRPGLWSVVFGVLSVLTAVVVVATMVVA